MNDGDKESIKELLAIFRTLMATAVSILLVATNLRFSGLLVPARPELFMASVITLLVACVSCLAMFFIVVPMIYHQQADIIYRGSVVTVGVVAITTFVASIVLLILSQGWQTD